MGSKTVTQLYWYFVFNLFYLQFSLLAEKLAQERQEIQIRKKAQEKVKHFLFKWSCNTTISVQHNESVRLYRCCSRWSASYVPSWSVRSASCRRSSSRTTRTTTSKNWRSRGYAIESAWLLSTAATAVCTDLCHGWKNEPRGSSWLPLIFAHEQHASIKLDGVRKEEPTFDELKAVRQIVTNCSFPVTFLYCSLLPVHMFLLLPNDHNTEF